jgi:hypothetical protein
VWVRDIELTAEQRARLRLLNPAYNRQLSGQPRSGAMSRATTRSAAGRSRPRKGGDALHVAGCMLYWAEGWKNRNQLSFANADPDMIRLFVRFLRSLECETNGSASRATFSLIIWRGNAKSRSSGLMSPSCRFLLCASRSSTSFREAASRSA